MTNCVWCTKAIADMDAAKMIESTLVLHGQNRGRRKYKLHYHPSCFDAFEQARQQEEIKKISFPKFGKVEASQ